ncbi:enoyl-CoA hydratase/isomerase family protein [Bordetella bronchialis]|uniref:Enoyl-CoA hydratase n=1 Tax=Bordetella bronchialis TaxID=463025 RepID=A0A193FUE6_9BORD|nr:enoyl-CoA hydratase/isomerase family protein [Bordetella bronchialis]ANN66297.1 enoyl-CoA hydratase [Bordetella bronchialis]ANN71377.1 enoyl-CoA hydratase [Bordetella bronchialis]
MTLADPPLDPPPAPRRGAGQVTCRREGAVAHVSLSHPGRMNAITVAMWRQLATLFQELSADRALRCVVVRGEDGHFAAGADIREFPTERGDTAAVVRYHRDILAPALRAIEACPHPVVARIEGVCVGGGLEIACQCDLRIAARTARLGAPINRLGFPMAPDEMRGLLNVAGRAVTLELLLEGRILDAQEAYAKGLLTRVVDDAGLDDELQRCVGRILGGAPRAASLNKHMAARLSRDEPLSEQEYERFFSYAESRDHREGVRAFLAGEAPTFTGDWKE